MHLGRLLLVLDADGDADVARELVVDFLAEGYGQVVVEAAGSLVEHGPLEEGVADGFAGEELGEHGGVSRERV